MRGLKEDTRLSLETQTALQGRAMKGHTRHRRQGLPATHADLRGVTLIVPACKETPQVAQR